LEKLKEGYEDHEDAKQLLQELILSGSNEKGFSLSGSLIKLNGKIWVGNNRLA
jgi:hypothetical protein